MKQQDDKSVILAQWQTCVQMADSVSKRRDTANQIFVALNLALIAALKWDFKAQSFVVLALGIVLCYVWHMIIKNFRTLNRAKYTIINNLEKELPVKPFSDEWLQLLNECRYKEGTSIESNLPIIFGVAYVVIGFMEVFVYDL